MATTKKKDAEEASRTVATTKAVEAMTQKAAQTLASAETIIKKGKAETAERTVPKTSAEKKSTDEAARKKADEASKKQKENEFKEGERKNAGGAPQETTDAELPWNFAEQEREATTLAIHDTVELYNKRKNIWLVAKVIRQHPSGELRVRYEDSPLETTITCPQQSFDSGKLRKVPMSKKPAASAKVVFEVLSKEAKPVDDSLPKEDSNPAEPPASEETADKIKLAADVPAIEEVRPALEEKKQEHEMATEEPALEDAVAAIEPPAAKASKDQKQAGDAQPHGDWPNDVAIDEVPSRAMAIATIEVLPAEDRKGEKPAHPNNRMGDIKLTNMTMSEGAPEKEETAARALSVEKVHAAAEAPAADLPNEEPAVNDAQVKERAKPANVIAERQAPKNGKSPRHRDLTRPNGATETTAPAAEAPKEEKPGDDRQPKEKKKPTEAPAPGKLRMEDGVSAEPVAIEDAIAAAESPTAETPEEEPFNEAQLSKNAKPADALMEHKLAAEATSIDEAIADQKNEDEAASCKLADEAPEKNGDQEPAQEFATAEVAKKNNEFELSRSLAHEPAAKHHIEERQQCRILYTPTGVKCILRARGIGGRRTKHARQRTDTLLANAPGVMQQKATRPVLQFRGSMQIFVKPLTGKSIAINVEPSDTILGVKKLLHGMLLIPTFHQQLIFCGRQLQNAHTISHYAIRKESTMHMVARLRGGMQAATGPSPQAAGYSQQPQQQAPYTAQAQQKDGFPDVVMKMPKNDRVVAKVPNGNMLTVLEVDGDGPNSQGRVRWNEMEGWVKMCNVIPATEPAKGSFVEATAYPQPQQGFPYYAKAQQKDDHPEVVMKMPKNGKWVAKVPNGEILTVLEVDGDGPDSQCRVKWKETEGWTCKETEGWVKMFNVIPIAEPVVLEAKLGDAFDVEKFGQIMEALQIAKAGGLDGAKVTEVIKAKLDEVVQMGNNFQIKEALDAAKEFRIKEALVDVADAARADGLAATIAEVEKQMDKLIQDHYSFGFWEYENDDGTSEPYSRHESKQLDNERERVAEFTMIVGPRKLPVMVSLGNEWTQKSLTNERKRTIHREASAAELVQTAQNVMKNVMVADDGLDLLELQRLTLKALKSKARTLGYSDPDFEKADESDDPKEAIIQLIIKDGGPSKYTTPKSVLTILQSETEPVKLLRGSWVTNSGTESQSRKLLRRQDLERNFPTAFLPPVEVLAREEVTSLNIFSISYCWRAWDHPDPDGKQLKVIKTKLKEYQDSFNFRTYFLVDGKDVGIFWDFCSLHQKDKNSKRTDMESIQFKEALASMDIWYMHVMIITFIVNGQWARELGIDYETRGWTHFERSCAELVKTTYPREGGEYWLMVATFDGTGRNMPLSPALFAKDMAHRRFTTKSDKETVVTLYTKASISALRGVVKMSLKGIKRGNIIDCVSVLHHCVSAELLELMDMGIDDAGAAAIGKALPRTEKLEVLGFETNKIGDAGAQAIAQALPRMRQLKSISFDWNQIGDTGAKAIADALPRMENLEHLYLGYNTIGDTGAKAIADALPRMEHLKSLYLGDNKIGDDGAKAIVQALPRSSSLFIGNNQLTEVGARALRQAWAAAGKNDGLWL